MSQLLGKNRVQWNPERNHIVYLTHVINLSVKEFLKTLKIQEHTPEDEWEVLKHQTHAASKKKKPKYKIKGINPFNPAIQKVRKISSLVNFPPGNLTSFVKVCEAVNIKPKRIVKDVETR